jgi:hypothetical protein
MKTSLPPYHRKNSRRHAFVFGAIVAALCATTAVGGSTITVSAFPSRITEEGQEATYTITATPSSGQRIAVTFGMGGSAALGSDYVLTGNFNGGKIVIPAGQPSTTVTLHALSDEPDGRKFETASMIILNGRGYHVGRQRAATIRIDQVP